MSRTTKFGELTLVKGQIVGVSKETMETVSCRIEDDCSHPECWPVIFTDEVCESCGNLEEELEEFDGEWLCGYCLFQAVEDFDDEDWEV